MWPTSVSSRNNSCTVIGGGNLRQLPPRIPDSSSSAAQAQRKKLVDMIQEDFPRTPSPVHTNPSSLLLVDPAKSSSSQTGIHLLGDPSGNNVNIEKSRKPFSISGSVDAVMAAAIEIEGDNDNADIDLNFGLQKLNLFEEDEENLNRTDWNSEIEPFTFAESFVPYVPVHPPTLNSAPARTASVYHSSSYPPQAALPPQQQQAAAAAALQTSDLKQVIMEDFRMNRSKRYELFDLKGMMIDFSTDQHGSRFIQQKLESVSDLEKEVVFNEIYQVALQLMTDVFGNYVIQKLFEHGSRDQRVALAHVMHGHVLNLSLQMYGCRVVQKALEHVPGDEQIRLVQELEGQVLRCVKDQNGNHVIQKCIECVPLNTSAPFLTASFLSQASTLAMHPYGCRVIQRIFEHGPPDHSQALLDELLKNTGTLIQDQYGNYVIQHVLEHGHPSERTRIIKFLQGRLLEYSRHKFASNVVEKCVSFGTESERQELIEEILTPLPSEDVDGEPIIPLHLMMKDQFANYVVQKMLEIVDGVQRDMLLNCIKPQLFQLKKYTYGKHILAKVERMLGLAPSEPIIQGLNGGHSNSNGYGQQQQQQYHQQQGYSQANQHPHAHHTSTYHPHGHGQYQGHYHSAPSSPVTRSHDFQYYPQHQTFQPPPHSQHPRPNEYRRPNNHHHHQNNNNNNNNNSRISKNDLNEFPPLNSRKK